MFSLAWLRAIAFFLLSIASLSYSREESVFTSSVTYCTPPESLLISRFEVAYFPSNESVSFNISAASVQANLNVTANLFLNVYGINPVNVTIDLCNILEGALCPLPAYNFTGADSLKLPSTLSVASMIPGIAFKIPDLEGFAQLTLRDIHTGALTACVQATLSNGWSAHQTAVEWTTGGIAIAALVLALLLSTLFTDALAPFRLLELIYLYQTIASSALLNLNYPSVYTSFALNFSWALGLFSSTHVQNSINQMRHLTGGKLADASSGPAVGLVNRKISPYNFQTIFSPALSALDPSRDFVSTAVRLVSRTYSSGLNAATSLMKRDTIQGEVQTVTASSSNVLQAGIPIYVNLINIATANAFMTIFFCILIMFAIGFAVAILGYGLLLALRHIRRKQDRHVNLKYDYPSFVKSWFLRMGLVASLPLLIFIFYQWTLKDSWLSILLSVITLLAVVGLIAYPVFLTLRRARHDSAYGLYTPGEAHINSYGVLYARYRPQRYYFFLIFLVATILRALFIAFARYVAEVQIALLLVVELGLVAAHLALKPFKNKGGDVFSTFLAIIRLVCTGMMIAFLESLQVKAIPRVVIGIVIAIIFSVSVLIVIFNLAVHSGLLLLWRRARSPRPFDSPRGSAGAILEKGMPESGSRHESSDRSRTDLESWDAYPGGRPTNPTPEQSLPLDNELLQPFPISPTATTITTMEPPSIYSRESGTMTLGSLLPRRWSFSLSPPTSPAGSSVAHGGSRQNSLHPGSSVGHRSLSPSPFPPASPSETGGGVTISASNHGQRQSYLQDQRIQEQNDQES